MNKIFLFMTGVSFLVIVATFLYYLHGFNKFYITAQFKELDPINTNVSVYFKGFKLGNVLRVYPTENFSKTNVDIVLNAKKINLPENIIAKVKVKDEREYIELIYPKMPAVAYLKNRSVIEGEKSTGISNFLTEQAESGGIDELKDNLNTTLLNVGDTFMAITDLVNTGNEILKDLRPSLKASGENLEKTTKNLANASQELDIIMHKSDIDKAISNLERTTGNLSSLSTRAEQESLMLLNCILKNANCLVLNLNKIVEGFKLTLGKRFATMRILFGKPIE